MSLNTKHTYTLIPSDAYSGVLTPHPNPLQFAVPYTLQQCWEKVNGEGMQETRVGNLKKITYFAIFGHNMGGGAVVLPTCIVESSASTPERTVGAKYLDSVSKSPSITLQCQT